MESGNNCQAPSDLPWKTRLFIAAYCFGVDHSCRSNGTLNRRLMSFFDPKSSSNPTNPINGVTSTDINIDDSINLWFRLYVPQSSSAATDDKLPVIFYFHGGGFVFCAPNSKPFDDLCRRLASQVPAIVVSVNYRLSPEHRFPTQYDDAFESLKFIDQSDAVLPPLADLSRCFLAGDSAGGNIAHNVALRASNHDFINVKIIGLMAIQPFFGGEERTESELRLTRAPMVNLERTDWMWKAFLPEGSDRDHEAANVFGGGTQILSGREYPATIVFVGGFDPLQDWQRRYGEGLKKCGKEVKMVEYSNAIHGFYAFPELPQAALFITEVRDFIRKQSSIPKTD